MKLKHLLTLILGLTILTTATTVKAIDTISTHVAAWTTSYVTGSNVNLRSFPGFRSSVIGVLEENERVIVKACSTVEDGNVWLLIYVPRLGQYGYVSGTYITGNYCRGVFY